MSKQHKWHKEIKAWADGAEIEKIWISDDFDNPHHWHVINNPEWDAEHLVFRIKPQPKEPQYLYVYLDDNYEFSPIPLTGEWEYIGKIKLEVED